MAVLFVGAKLVHNALRLCVPCTASMVLKKMTMVVTSVHVGHNQNEDYANQCDVKCSVRTDSGKTSMAVRYANVTNVPRSNAKCIVLMDLSGMTMVVRCVSVLVPHSVQLSCV